MRGAVPDGQQVVVPRNVAVPRQVIGVLKVAGTPAAGILDYADSGLWGSKENWAVVTSSSPKTPDPYGSLPALDIHHCGSAPQTNTPMLRPSPCQFVPVPRQAQDLCARTGENHPPTPPCHPVLTNFIDVFIGC